MTSSSSSFKSYADSVAQGLEFLESSPSRHPNSFGTEGQAYFCTSNNCMYVKVGNTWELFSGEPKLVYMWCPHCFKKHKDYDMHDLCNNCKKPIIALDINDAQFEKLDEYCTKGDIMEVALGGEN